MENNYRAKIIEYRDVKSSQELNESSNLKNEEEVKDEENSGSDDDSEEEGGSPVEAPQSKPIDNFVTTIPSMQFLWSFRCELTRGRPVTQMTWNKSNDDIIGIAYRDSKTNPDASQGLILCWSLKNPEWPERIYRTNSPVTSIDFSRSNSNLLAAGFKDGRISIYDVRKKSDMPLIDNTGMTGKHHESVWEVKWVERERVHGDEQSKGENLLSVSTDGRVTQWMIRKGLEYTGIVFSNF